MININNVISELMIQKNIIGFAAINYEIEVGDVPKKSFGYVSTKKPYIRISKNLPDDEQVGVLVHELYHVLLEHISRGKGKDLELWNWAADIEINSQMILEDKQLLKVYPGIENLMKNSLTLSSVKDFKVELKDSAEKIYSKLLAKQEEAKKRIKFNAAKTKVAIYKPEGTPDDAFIEGSFDDVKYRDDVVIVNVLPPEEGKEGTSQNEKIARNTKTRARMAGCDTSKIEKALKRAKVANKILDIVSNYVSSIDSELGEGAEEFTYSKVNNFCGQLPGRRELTVSMRNMLLVVDESGSMTDDEISTVVYGVYDATSNQSRFVQNLYLIQHDIEATLTRVNDSTVYIRKHRGGTSHKEVYKLIKNIDVKFELIVFVTDGWSDIPEQDWSSLEQGHKLWLITDTENKDAKKWNEVGEVLYPEDYC